MRIEDIRRRLRAHGAKPCHEACLLRAWAQVQSLDNRHRRAEDYLPLAVRALLPALTA
jgi:23S rRNA (adenine2503-C2)-methyltransferase